MSEGQWMRVAYASVAAVVAGFVASALDLPGADAAAAWLVALGLLGGAVSVVFGLLARRRERRAAEAEAEAEAADELDRQG